MALQAGRLFGNYRVVRLIGEGAFGEVYLAENPRIERRVAIKILRPMLAQDAELVRRFFNEARAASAIRHPSIVEVFDAGETPEGFPYILMEFLEGVSLKKRLAEVGRLSVAQALEIASQAGSALAAAHAIGIVHRDLKPENLFLVPEAGAPGGERVKILDFGIAKVKQQAGAAGSFRTESGLIMGSPTYMSPEQCKDSADVDLRADIYSLATIVYEMMAGRPPYLAPTGVELLLMHLNQTPRPLRELVPHVPSQVQDAVMRALRQERSDRFEEVAGFVTALTQWAGSKPTETLPGEYGLVSGPSAVPPVDRAGAIPAASTLVPASPENAGKAGSQTYRTRPSWERWLGLAAGGLGVAVLVYLLLFHHGHDAHTPAMLGVTVPPPAAAGSPKPPSDSVATAAPGIRADAGPKIEATRAAPNPANTINAALANQTVREQPTPPRAASPSLKRPRAAARRRSETTSPAARHEQEDIAGF